MKFRILHHDKSSSARVGEVETEHGTFLTPVFMPVGTAGTVKGIHQRELAEDLKAEIILANTYHLYLRPGMDVLKNAGGLHKFMSWDKVLLTDSGGYQVFSLADRRKLTNEGVIFNSHIDGSRHLFSPENVVDIERIIGADIMMALDECTPFPCDYKYAKRSLELTHQWLDRGVKRFKETENSYGYIQSYFPIVQGSIYKDLRTRSAEEAASLDMDGNAIGGLSVGEPVEELYSMTEVVTGILPRDKPRYLMGVGTPVNILECISLGIDMFDCVIPTRNGRNGMLFTEEGIINIKNEKWKNDLNPIDPQGTSFVDHSYSKAYLRHLILSGEILGAQIASIHNLAFYFRLIKEAGEKIRSGEFVTWKTKMTEKLATRL